MIEIKLETSENYFSVNDDKTTKEHARYERDSDVIHYECSYCYHVIATSCSEALSLFKWMPE